MLGAMAAMAAMAAMTQAQAQSFTESFDDVSLLPGNGWLLQNNSTPVGSMGWFQGTATTAVPTPGPFNSYNGATNAYIAANFNSTGSTGTISNWLLMPNRTFRNGDVLSFYTRKPTVSPGQTDYPDRLEVRLSTNGASTNSGTGATGLGDFTTLLLSVNPTLVANVYPQVWTQQTITISGLPAPTSGRAAFRYFVTGAGSLGSNSDYIGIDQVAYTPYVCPTFTMTTGGALTDGAFDQAYSTSLTQTGALGAPNFAITAGALPPGVTLSASGQISGSPTATGTFHFTSTVNDASGCSGSTSYSIAISTAEQSIDFPAQTSANQPYAANGTFNIAPVATASSGLEVEYVSTTSGVCSVNNTTVTIHDVGTCTLSASQAGDSNYDAATSVTQSVTIDQAQQNIAFSSTAPENAQIDTDYTVSATGGLSGNPVSFEIDASSMSICSITDTDNTVTFNAAGTCIINANQAGNNQYSAAAQQQQTIEVAPISGAGIHVNSTPNPSLPGQEVSFTITVAMDLSQSSMLRSKATPIATGTVELFNGSDSLGIAQLDNGAAMITTSELTTAGEYPLQVSYSGDDNYEPVNAQEILLTQTVTAVPVVATPVPTLGEWMLLMLSLVLAGFAMLQIRRNKTA